MVLPKKGRNGIVEICQICDKQINYNSLDLRLQSGIPKKFVALRLRNKPKNLKIGVPTFGSFPDSQADRSESKHVVPRRLFIPALQ